jgi:hypothetical protein|tara:strand:- start:815 stop:916 length:102 start_codon:yes stop_codon:yes gene_type:complete
MTKEEIKKIKKIKEIKEINLKESKDILKGDKND